MYRAGSRKWLASIRPAADRISRESDGGTAHPGWMRSVYHAAESDWTLPLCARSISVVITLLPKTAASTA